MQKKKDFWKDWQDEYEKEREALLAELNGPLADSAGLSAEEASELTKKYR